MHIALCTQETGRKNKVGLIVNDEMRKAELLGWAKYVRVSANVNISVSVNVIVRFIVSVRVNVKVKVKVSVSVHL